MPVIVSDENNLGYKICQNIKHMEESRANWQNYWDLIAKFFIPKKDNIYGQGFEGQRRENFLYDSTSINAVQTLASALHTYLTNQYTDWFDLTSDLYDLNENDEVVSWFQETREVMLYIIRNSNFNTEIYKYYEDLISFGTPIFRVEEDEKDVIRCHVCPVYEHYVQENNLGLVDTVYRKFSMTAIQIKQQFGMKVFEKYDDLKDMLINKPDTKFQIIHAVEPKSRYSIQKTKITKPFRSVYVLEKYKEVLIEEGFTTNPYIVSRFNQLSGEVYGRSPSMRCLSDVMSLNELVKTVIKAAQLTVAPPFQVPSDGVLLPLRMKPYGTNIYRANSKDRIEPLMTNVRPEIAFELLQRLVLNIENAFHIQDLKLAEQRPEMTATEVMQRSEENMRFLSPIVGRQEYEFLNPFVNRVFDIASKKGFIPEMPLILQDALAQESKIISIRYTSPLARAQKANDADAIIRGIQTMSPIFEIQPESTQNLDGDTIVRRIANYFGWNQKLLVDVEDRDAIREQQFEMQQQQAEMQQAQQASEINKNIEQGEQNGQQQQF